MFIVSGEVESRSQRLKELVENGSMPKITELFANFEDVWIKRSNDSWQSGLNCEIKEMGSKIVVGWPHPKKKAALHTCNPSVEKFLQWQDDNNNNEAFPSFSPENPLSREELEIIFAHFMNSDGVWVKTDGGSLRKGMIYGIKQFGKRIEIIFSSLEITSVYECITITAREFFETQEQVNGVTRDITQD